MVHHGVVAGGRRPLGVLDQRRALVEPARQLVDRRAQLLVGGVELARHPQAGDPLVDPAQVEVGEAEPEVDLVADLLAGQRLEAVDRPPQEVAVGLLVVEQEVDVVEGQDRAAGRALPHLDHALGQAQRAAPRPPG